MTYAGAAHAAATDAHPASFPLAHFRCLAPRRSIQALCAPPSTCPASLGQFAAHCSAQPVATLPMMHVTQTSSRERSCAWSACSAGRQRPQSRRRCRGAAAFINLNVIQIGGLADPTARQRAARRCALSALRARGRMGLQVPASAQPLPASQRAWAGICCTMTRARTAALWLLAVCTAAAVAGEQAAALQGLPASLACAPGSALARVRAAMLLQRPWGSFGLLLALPIQKRVQQPPMLSSNPPCLRLSRLQAREQPRGAAICSRPPACHARRRRQRPPPQHRRLRRALLPPLLPPPCCRALHPWRALSRPLALPPGQRGPARPRLAPPPHRHALRLAQRPPPRVARVVST